MKLKDFFKKGQKVQLGNREVTILGPTKERGGRKLYLVLVPWTESELEYRKKHNLEDTFDLKLGRLGSGQTTWVAEDQLKM